MESNRPAIFLGSTFEDLKEHRELIFQIFNKLRIIPLAMEFIGAKPGTTTEECIKLVKKADIFVLIIGTRYGFMPDKEKSITEIEYETALENKLDIYAYLINEDEHNVLPKTVDTGDKRSRLQKFRQRVEKRHITPTFNSPESLAVAISTDMVDVIASIDIDRKVQKMLKKKQEISLSIKEAGYASDRRPASVSIAHNLKSGNTRFTEGITALYLANKIADGNFKVLKGYLTFNLSTWRLFILFLREFKVDTTLLSKEINEYWDLDYIRLLIHIVGDLSLSECAESVCIAARSINANREMRSLTKKYEHVVTPFYDVVSNALSNMDDLEKDTLKIQMEQAKAGERWHAYKAFEKAEKNLKNRES